MRKLWKNKHGDLGMILSAIVMAIGLTIGIIIVFNVIAAVDSTTIDASLTGTPAAKYLRV